MADQTSSSIANRGEIAVRIIRAARELGHQDRAGAFSAADAEIAGRADGGRGGEDRPAAAAKSYLNIEAILEGREGDRRRRRPSRLWLPRRERGLRRCGRSGRPDLRRPERRDDPHDGRQGRRARWRPRRPAFRSCRAPTAVSTIRSRRERIAQAIGFPGDDQGRGRRRRARHPHRPRHDEFETLMPQAQRRGARPPSATAGSTSRR